MRSDRRRGIRKPNAQQSLLEGAAIARRAERRRLAGLAQQVAGLAQQGDGRPPEAAGGDRQPEQGSVVVWVGCQWLMDGYCGRAEEATVGSAANDAATPQEQSGDNGPDDNNRPHWPNRAA